MSFRRAPTLHLQIGHPGRSRHGGLEPWTTPSNCVVVPVSDVDRAKAFYIDQAGFELLVDSQRGADFRVVQLVPKGSACAIAIGDRDRLDAPGLAARPAPRASRTSRPPATSSSGAAREVGEIFHFGEAGQTPGLGPGAAQLRDVHAVRGSGRQHLAGPGGQARLALQVVKVDEVAA